MKLSQNPGCPIHRSFIAMSGTSSRSDDRLLLPITSALCIALLTTFTALAQAPAPAAPANDAPVVITKPLSNQPASKPVSRRQAREADDAYLAGAALLEKNQPEKAQAAFERAAKLNPEKQEYSVAVAIARENVVTAMVRKSEVMRSAGDNAGAEALLTAAAKIDPSNEIVTEHMHPGFVPQVLFEPALPSSPGTLQPRYAQIVQLAANDTTQSFHFRADAHEALRRILLAYGLKAQFNTDVPATSVRIDVDDVNFQQMQPILAVMTNTFLVPIDASTALVLKETRENHDQFDHLALETIYMPGFTSEQVHEATSMLQEVLGLQKVVTSAEAGTVSIRAPQDMMNIANYELADLLDGGSQLVLEMKVYSIDKSNTKNIGLNVGTSLTAFNIYAEATQIVNQYSSQIAAAIASGLIPAGATPLQIAGYLIGSGLLGSNSLLSNGILGTVGGGLTYTGVTASSLPSINFGLNESEAQSIEDLQVGVGDKKTATFRVGTHYPIITASYSAGGVASSLLSGATSAQLAALGISSSAAAAAATQVSIPQIQYEDLGLTLKATPTVLRSGNVSMQLDLKIEALAGSSLNDIPILASRALTSNVTIGQGQTAVIVSSLSRQESAAVSGIPGLSELPGFQSTTDKDAELDTSELVITLTPRLVRRGHDRIASVPLLFPHTAAGQAHDED